MYNIGTADRTARLIVGGLLALIGLAMVADVVAVGQLFGTVALVAGVVLIGTALVRTCLLYRLLGIDTVRSG